jgi:probable addiction module antidote protein
MEEKITVADWDSAEDIKTPEDVFGYLEAALAEHDPEVLFDTIGDIARSQGMACLSRELGLDKAGLYRSLSAEGNPSFVTVWRVLDKLGFQIDIKRKEAA